VNPVPFHLLHIHNNQWKILGAKVSTREELDRVVRLVEEGVIEPEISGTMPLTRANDAIGTIRRGEVCGRIVLTHGEDT
jgi:D-arabinose 1-dehydrogenase-like Zn-dependent alcohol dehydrogenase